MSEKKNNSIVKSVKWSSLAEAGVKLITPVTTMILARILTPEAFGILAVCNMILFFGDIIADAGFAKYIVQADFTSDTQLFKYTTVAFWSHLVLSVGIWIIIFLFASKLACFLGIEGYRNVIIISSLSLILKSLISTQIGILRRKFEFKKAFVARILTVVTIFIVTIPLALWTKSYWALIIGNLVGNFINTIALIFLTKWWPELFYSFTLLKEMFSFSFWSMMEGLAHWFIFWFDVFIVTQFFTTYLVGLYKNSTAIILSFITMITAAISPVLLSTLSRLKNNNSYIDIYMSITKLLMFVILPVCILIFFCKDFVTLVLLGSKWMEGADIIGAWALMLGVSVFIYSFPAEVYKSKGIPKYLFYYQSSYLFFLVPICIYAATFGFWSFVYARVCAILIQIILFFIFNNYFLKWKPSLILEHLRRPLLVSIAFFIICYFTLPYVENMFLKVAIGLMLLTISSLLTLKYYKKDITQSVAFLTKKEINYLITLENEDNEIEEN